MVQRKKDANFAFMLAGVLTALIVLPILLEFGLESYGISVQLILSITLILSVWSAIESRGWFVSGVVLVVVNATCTVIAYFQPGLLVAAIGLAGLLAFCIFSIAFAVDCVIESGSFEITVNRLIGAVSVYLLLGIAFSMANMLIELLLPGSFAGLPVSGQRAQGYDLIYYSYVTMTTLGYGDVTPARPLAKALAYITAVAGQFYIATLVAGLVGGYVTQKHTSAQKQ